MIVSFVSIEQAVLAHKMKFNREFIRDKSQISAFR